MAAGELHLAWGVVVFTKPNASIHLLDRPNVVVGRALDADVVVEDGSVSRQHCVLSRSDIFEGADIRATLHNVSKNGTVVEAAGTSGSGGFVAVPQHGTCVLEAGSAVELTETCSFIFAPLSRLEDAARRQVELYFSKENVRRDAHLQRLMDAHGGAVPLSTLMSRLQPVTPLELARAMHSCPTLERTTLDSGGTGVRERRTQRTAVAGSLEALLERACDAIGTLVDGVAAETDERTSEANVKLHAIAEANAGWVPLVDVMEHADAAPALEAWLHASLRAAQALGQEEGASLPPPSPRTAARAADAAPASDAAAAPCDALCPFELVALGGRRCARVGMGGVAECDSALPPPDAARPRYVRDLGLALSYYLGGSYDAERDAKLAEAQRQHEGGVPLAFVATLPRVQRCLEAQIAAQMSAPSSTRTGGQIDVGKGQEGGGFALRKRQRRYSSKWDHVGGSGGAVSVLDALTSPSPRRNSGDGDAATPSLGLCATPRSTSGEKLSLVQHAARAQVLALLRKHRLRKERIAAGDEVLPATVAASPPAEEAAPLATLAPVNAPPKSPRVSALIVAGDSSSLLAAGLSPESPPWTPTPSPPNSFNDDTPLRPPNPLRIVSPGASPIAGSGGPPSGGSGGPRPLVLPVVEDRDAILSDRDAMILEALIAGNDGWAPLEELMHFPCMQPVGEAELARALVTSDVVAVMPLSADGTSFAVYPRAAALALSPVHHPRRMLPHNWAPTSSMLEPNWGFAAHMTSPPAKTPTVGARMSVRASGGISAGGDDAAATASSANRFDGLYSDPAAAAAGVKLVSVMTYNVLAEKYAHSFSYTEPSALQWSFRSEVLKAEILGTRPHLLCLQEVQCGPTEASDHSRWFQEWLRLEGGYNCAFCPKMDAGGFQLDGVQIGNLIAWHAADFDVVGDVLHVSLDREILERGLLPFDEVQWMGQVAIFAALRERSTSAMFILSTT